MLRGIRGALGGFVCIMLLVPRVWAADTGLREIECSRRYEAEVRQAWGGLRPTPVNNPYVAQDRGTVLRQAEWNLQDCLREVPPAEVKLSRAIHPAPAQPVGSSATQIRASCSGFLKLMCP